MVGILLIIFGVVYVVKPDIFRRWVWTRTDIFQQALSPERYIIFMRILGVLLIALGVFLVVQH